MATRRKTRSAVAGAIFVTLLLSIWLVWPDAVSRDISPPSTGSAKQTASNSSIIVNDNAPSPPAQTTADATREFSRRSTPLTTDRLVDLLGKNDRRAWATIAEQDSGEALRVLILALKSERYAADWGRLLAFCYQFPGNESLSDALVDFVKRDEPILRSQGQFVRLDIPLKKEYAISVLGFTGGPVAFSVLRDAITADGALKVAEAWLEFVEQDSFYGGSTIVIAGMRSSAANGLALSQDPTNIDILKNHYRTEHARIKTYLGPKLGPGETQRRPTVKERAMIIVYRGLGTAMAKVDLIADLGSTQKLVELSSEEHIDEKLSALGPYVDTYTIYTSAYRLPELAEGLIGTATIFH